MVIAVEDDAFKELSDEELAEGIVSDFNAFSELYGRYLCRIYRFVRSQVPDEATAEDLTAHTFFKAFSSAEGYRAEGSYRSWIFRIASNSISSWRARSTKGPVILEQVPEFADPAPCPASVAVTGDEQRLVWDLVTRLPRTQREVLALRYLEDLEIEEVARVTGRTRGAVRILLHRARSSLRRELEKGAI